MRQGDTRGGDPSQELLAEQGRAVRRRGCHRALSPPLPGGTPSRLGEAALAWGGAFA